MYRLQKNLIRWIRGAVTVMTIALILPSTLSAQDRLRKSIDDLTAQELEDFLHATMKLREKGTNDPTVNYSYAHMARLHNIPGLFDGGCEHWNHRFLAWHRALLYNYEDALRASDPPRTTDVTIPYWNWTETPTGRRYPVAFENDAAGVKAHYGKAIDSELLTVLFRSARNSQASQPIYPWTYIAEIAKPEQEQEQERDVDPDADSDPTPDTTTAFLGSESDHGALENPPHDVMHGFMGGALDNTSTAANDPIFWSFHAFVDLVWWWRQQEIADTVPCADCMLQGMPAQTAAGTAGPIRVEDVTDSTGQLGVEYEFRPPGIPAIRSQLPARTLSARLPWLAAKALERPDVLRQFLTTAPPRADSEFVIELVGVRIPTVLAYVALVFVHPSEVDFAQGSVEFRDRYLVGHFGQWANGHELNSGDVRTTREFRIAVDRDTYPELADSPGAQLSVTVAVYVMSTDDPELRAAIAEDGAGLRSSALDILDRETAMVGVAEVSR